MSRNDKPTGGRKRPAVQITIDPALLKRVDVAAERAGQTRSMWIQIACVERLKREKSGA